jgi:hypothetical protein
VFEQKAKNGLHKAAHLLSPLAKAGGSNCKLRGLPTLVTEQGAVEKAERSGGLHKRSAEDWGHGLRARGAELPLEGSAVAFREMCCGQKRPAEGQDVYYRPGSPSIARCWTGAI